MAKGIKTGGREAGTPNRLTTELRTILKNLIYDELQNLPEHLLRIEPKERLEIVLKLMPFVCPKVQDVPHDKGEPISYDWTTV